MPRSRTDIDNVVKKYVAALDTEIASIDAQLTQKADSTQSISVRKAALEQEERNQYRKQIYIALKKDIADLNTKRLQLLKLLDDYNAEDYFDNELLKNLDEENKRLLLDQFYQAVKAAYAEFEEIIKFLFSQSYLDQKSFADYKQHPRSNMIKTIDPTKMQERFSQLTYEIKEVASIIEKTSAAFKNLDVSSIAELNQAVRSKIKDIKSDEANAGEVVAMTAAIVLPVLSALAIIVGLALMFTPAAPVGGGLVIAGAALIFPSAVAIFIGLIVAKNHSGPSNASEKAKEKYDYNVVLPLFDKMSKAIKAFTKQKINKTEKSEDLHKHKLFAHGRHKTTKHASEEKSHKKNH